MKKGFVADIEKATTSNTDYRRVLYTGKYSQLVLMSLKPGDEIGVRFTMTSTSSSASSRETAR